MRNTAESRVREIRILHRARSHSQADIKLVEKDGQTYVMRDYSGPRPLVFHWLCRWAVRRELKVHRLLEGVRGIPELVEVLDENRYLIEFVRGRSLAEVSNSPLGPEFFERLSRVVRSIHERGVAHGDLRNKNILVREDGEPYLIDFSTAWWSFPFWRKPLFLLCKQLDQRRLAKSKSRLAPEALTEEEVHLLHREPWYLRVGHLYRHGLYRLLRKHKRNN